MAIQGLSGQKAAALALLTTAVCPSTWAADSSPGGLAGSPQSPGLEEIIVTARKRTERLEDVPAAITVVDAGVMLENHDVSLQDYYATVPGLSYVSLGNGQSTLMMRGVSTGISGNPTVGITIDDVPVGATQTAIINGSAYIPDFDPADLQNVEFLKGPQGTLYGASSIGGVVRYVTAVPDLTTTSGRVQVDGSVVSSGGTGYGVRGSVNVPLIPQTLAVRVSAFDRRDPGYVDDPSLGQRNVNSADVYGTHLDALLQATDNFSVRLTAFVQRTEGNGDSNLDTTYQFKGILGDLTHTRMVGTGDYVFNWQLYSAVLKYQTELLEVTSISAFSKFRVDQNIDQTQQYGFLSELVYGVGGTSERWINTNKKVSQELRVSSRSASKLSWEVGGFFTKETNGPGDLTLLANDLSTGVPVPDGVLLDYYINPNYEEYAGFANVAYHFTDQFDLQVGAREGHNKQDYYQNVSGAINGPPAALSTRSQDSSFTYSVTPRFRVSSATMLYASVSSGYGAGGPNTPEFPSPTIPVTFSPSKTVNYELGVKNELFERRLTLNADVFYIDWSNIQLAGTDVNGTTYTFNGGKAKSQGLEFEAMARPVEGLTLSATAAYIDAKLTTDAGHGFPGVAGNALPFSSKYSASLSAQEQFSLGNSIDGFVGVTGAYVGKRYEGFPADLGEPQPVIPSYKYANLKTGIKTRGYTLTFFAKNITNERGVLDSSQETGATATSGLWHTVFITPRTLGLSLVKEF